MRKRLAIVTGSSGFIGRAICLDLLQAGYRCVGVDLRDSDNQGWEFRTCDLAIVAQIETEFAALCATCGTPDVLVNCAGLARHRNFFEVTASDFDATFAVNARGLFFASQTVARQMMAVNQPGVIINIESVGGFLSTVPSRSAPPASALPSVSKRGVPGSREHVRLARRSSSSKKST